MSRSDYTTTYELKIINSVFKIILHCWHYLHDMKQILDWHLPDLHYGCRSQDLHNQSCIQTEKSSHLKAWFSDVYQISVSQGTSSTTAPMWTPRSMIGSWSLWWETDWPIRFRGWRWTPHTTSRSRPETPKAWDPCQTRCSSAPRKVKPQPRLDSPIKT